MFHATRFINPIYAAPIAQLGIECNKHDVPYTCEFLWDGLQLRFPWCDGDIICHNFSYGHANGNVESYGFPWDKGDCTELSVDEAIELLVDYYTEVRG